MPVNLEEEQSPKLSIGLLPAPLTSSHFSPSRPEFEQLLCPQMPVFVGFPNASRTAPAGAIFGGFGRQWAKLSCLAGGAWASTRFNPFR